VIQTIRNGADAELYLDWGGGLIWLRLLNELDDVSAAQIRSAIQSCGGHATLMRANAEIRSRTAVFQPQATALEALNQRVKQGFDPANILNPGRMALIDKGAADAD